MLKEFTAKNFLSINEGITFSMETGAYLKKYSETNVYNENGNRLLKNAVIFGPNGSGKTNIITAIRMMKQMVMKNTKTVTSSLPFTPFSFGENNEKGTKFEIRFIYKNNEYQYGFLYNQEEILSESLIYFSKGNKKTIFLIDKQAGLYETYEELDIEINNLRDNQLLLFELQNINEFHSSNVFRWFSDYLIIDNFSEVSEIADSSLVKNILDTSNKERLLEYLKYADSNIIDVDIVKEKREDDGGFEKILRMLEILDDEFSHKKYDVDEIIPKERYTLHTVYNKFDDNGNIIGTEKLSLGSESSGTEKMIKIALVLLDIGNSNKTILIDELDRSLHYNIIIALVKLFNSKENNNQLIFTTHNVLMIDESLRTDQIYFVEKDYKGNTNLYSLFDFNELELQPRSDIKYLKRYIEGQFGAMPDVDAERMICILQNDEVN